MNPVPEPAQRLFFALWPDEAQQRSLGHATAKPTRSCGGRPVPPPKLHVTLAFLGSVPQTRLPEVKAIAQKAAEAHAQSEPLSLRFERLAHWKRPELLVVLAAEEPSAVAALAEALKDATAAAGFAPDLKPFRAHVTLARKVLHAPARSALHQLVWYFDAFALIDSRTEPEGPVYSVIETFPLVKTQKVHE